MTESNKTWTYFAERYTGSEGHTKQYMEHCTRCKEITRAAGSGSLFFVFCSQHVGGQQGLVNSTVPLLSSHLGAPRMSHEHDEYSCIMYELKDVCAGYHELPHICTLMALDFRIHGMLHPRRPFVLERFAHHSPP